MDVTHLSIDVATVLTAFSGMAVTIWRTSAMAAKLQLSTEINERRGVAMMAALEELPLVRQRIGQLEHLQQEEHRKLYSDFPARFSKLESAVEVLRTKAESTDRFRAMRSRPDPEEIK